jgi:hypothetical protein
MSRKPEARQGIPLQWVQIAGEDDDGFEQGCVKCPHCGEVGGMEDGDQPDEIGPDRDEFDSPSGTRGGWTSFRGDCSNCGCFLQHRLTIRRRSAASFRALSAQCQRRPPALTLLPTVSSVAFDST